MTALEKPARDGSPLRRKADSILDGPEFRARKEAMALSPEGREDLLHELLVHQIELEMQNEELRRTQEELTSSQVRYFELYNLAPVGYCTLSEQGRILETNVAAAAMFVLPPFSIVQRPFTDFIAREDQDSYYMHCRRMAEQSAPQVLELRLLKADGSTFWVRLDTGLIRDGLESPQVRMVLTDISERKASEAALVESEASFRALAENNLDVIMRFDRQFRHLYTNRQSVLQAGIPREAFLGKTCREMGFPRALADQWEEVLERTFTTGTVQRLEFQLPTGVWIDWLCMPEWDEEGGVKAVMASARDISLLKRVEGELRESQESLSNFIDHAVLGFYRSALDGRPLMLNQALCGMLGFKDLEDAEQHFEQRPMGSLEINEAYSRKRFYSEIEAKGCVVGLESPWKRPDGETVVVRESAWVVRDESGCPKCFEGIMEDITELKALERQRADLEERNHQLQRAESLGCMASAIAHHFNNKLQAVRSCLEVLRELPQGLDPARILDTATRATEKAAEMSRLMLLYLGQTSTERKPVHLVALGKRSLPLLREGLPAHVTLKTAWPSSDSIIHGDDQMLLAVLKGLVTNAGEALGDARGTVGLGVTLRPAATIPTRNRFPVAWEPSASMYACLEVTDTGCGIPDSDIEKLFEPFFTTKFVGRGLGLPVIQGIVQAHGGVITVESRVGHGSAFRVHLPISAEGEPARSGKKAPSSGIVGGGTILVVDDDPALVTTTEMLLKQIGYQVLTAQDGLEALDVFRSHRGEISCVLTDLTMPKMNGWETLAALRQMEPTLPVILASGYDKAHVLSGSHAEQPQVILGKPFGFQQLLAALEQAMDAREERPEAKGAPARTETLS